MLKNVLIFSLIIFLLILSGDEAEAQESPWLFPDLVPCVYCSSGTPSTHQSQDGENPQDSESFTDSLASCIYR